MLCRTILYGLFLALAAHTQTTVGWYNGDCHSAGYGGWANWYLANDQFTRVYDNFLVPAGGWTVTGVFSNNLLLNAPLITQTAWEIRSGLSSGNGGTVVASGVSPASETYSAALKAYKIEVDGLQVQLPPGEYSLNVTPVGTAFHQSYVCETQGQNAIGAPAGSGSSYYSMNPAAFTWMPSETGDFLNCSQGVLIGGPSQPPPSTTDQWRANLASLVQQMPALHSVPFPGISLADWTARATDLANGVPTLSDAEIRTGFEELVASIEDPHTDVGWPYPNWPHLLPLSFYWFDDGIYVTGASAQYQSLLGGQLLAVGQTGIADATRVLTALVAHDNDQWLRHRVPLQELTNGDYLFGTGLIPSTDIATLQTTATDGSSSVVSTNIQTVRDTQMPKLIPVFQGVPPFYMQHPELNYWATTLDQGATIYFQYNSCMEDPKQPSAAFFQQLDQMMAQPAVQRIVLDMRNNSGGYTSILSPWIDEIQASRFNQPGRLYVIVGRATFSAAMEATNHLHDWTAAIFVGEPTGAKPQFELRRGDFALPYGGITVSYSNGVEGANDPDNTLTPDIVSGLTFQQYMSGDDPALDAILSIPVPQSTHYPL